MVMKHDGTSNLTIGSCFNHQTPINKRQTVLTAGFMGYAKKERHMREIHTKQRAVLFGIFLLIAGALNNANAENSKFIHFRFGPDVSIDVPRNWYFQDKNIRQHLNTHSEDVIHFAGIAPVPGREQILVAANIRTTLNSAVSSAFMRLIVRKGKFMSQSKVRLADIEKFRRVAQAQINDELRISLEEDKNLEGIYLATVNIEKLGNYYSVVVYKIFEYTDWMEMDRIDYIYLGNIAYILNTSYRTDKERKFKPILKIIRESLSIPAN